MNELPEPEKSPYIYSWDDLFKLPHTMFQAEQTKNFANIGIIRPLNQASFLFITPSSIYHYPCAESFNPSWFSVKYKRLEANEPVILRNS